MDRSAVLFTVFIAELWWDDSRIRIDFHSVVFYSEILVHFLKSSLRIINSGATTSSITSWTTALSSQGSYTNPTSPISSAWVCGVPLSFRLFILELPLTSFSDCVAQQSHILLFFMIWKFRLLFSTPHNLNLFPLFSFFKYLSLYFLRDQPGSDKVFHQFVMSDPSQKMHWYFKNDLLEIYHFKEGGPSWFRCHGGR